MTSRVTCSGSADGVDDHRILAAGLGDQRHDRAVAGGEAAVDRPRGVGRAGEGDAGDFGMAVSAAPTLPSPGASWTIALGMPAACISSIARAPISGVCSAGLAMAALPAASAAATGPMKIASGKFHGQMQANTPRPWRRSSLSSPVGPGSAVTSPHRRRASLA